MSIGKGISSHIGFGGEVTYGTKGAIDLFYRVLTENLRHVKETFVSESLNPDWNDFIYYGQGKNEGSIVFEQGYTGLELFWHSLLGTYTYSVDTPVAGVNSHAFAYDPTTNAFPVGMSIEAIRGIAGTKEMSYLGMKTMKATIEFTPGQLMRTTFDMVGSGYSRGAATAATFPTDNFIVPNQKTTLTVNGTALTVLSGSIEVEVILADSREHYGELFFKEPIIIGRPTGAVTLECEYSDGTGADSDALMQAYQDETELTGPVLTHEGAILTGVTKESFSVAGTKLWITEAAPATTGFDITNISINGRIANGFTATMINATTQVT